MKTITIDASCAISWLFVEQRTAAADRLLRAPERNRWVAPDVLPWELANFISKRVRAGRTDPDAVRSRLERLDIDIASPHDGSAVLDLVGPAVIHGLRVFDTAYLLDALGRGSALASRDGPLIDAARAAGVDVFDLRD